MNNSEIPVKAQENPLPEERRELVDKQEGSIQQPVAAYPSEPYVEPSMPPPYVPPLQPPIGPGYSSGARPPWAEQPGTYYPRRRSRRPWIVLTIVLLFLLLFGGVAFLLSMMGYIGYTGSLSETRHFSVSAGPTLILNSDTGSIHVRAVPSENDVSIQATKHSSPWGNPNTIKVSYTQNREANTITVNVESESSFFNWVSVDFDIAVPNAATLQLKTSTGSIDVSGVSGEMTLTSNTGSIAVSDGTVSGNTQLISNTGSINFNGAIAGSGSYRFETNTGSVNVTLPTDSVFHVDASTDTGTISTNVPGVTVQPHQVVGADAHGDVGNSPQATISLRTNTGAINLYQR